MGRLSKKEIRILAVVVFLLLFSSTLHLIGTDCQLLSAAIFLIVFLIYSGLLAVWCISIQWRIMNSHIKRNLLRMGGCMLFWVFVRTCKFRFFDGLDPVIRFLWYCYYIPMILIPLFGFLAAICLNRPENWRPQKTYNLFYGFAVLLIFGVLTNDYHQLAFSFRPDMVNWPDEYTYGIAYYLAAGWILGLSLATLILLFKKCRIPQTKKRMWLPLGVIAAGLVYFILYAIDDSRTGFGFIEITAGYGTLMVGLWESCIRIGLISSNTKYRDFFYTSPLAAQIHDINGNVHYASKYASPVSEAVYHELKEVRTIQDGPDTRLHASPIRGGYVVWREDVSHIERLLEELKDTNAELQDSVALLQAEIDTKAEHLHIQEQKRLYNLISEQARPQLRKISSNLDAMHQAGDVEKYRILQEINVIGAYLKRRFNLILMAEGKEEVTTEELGHCFHESFENLKVCGVRCSLSIQTYDKISPGCAVLFYDLFEAVIETGLSVLRILYITLADRDGGLQLSIQLESDAGQKGLPDGRWRREEVGALGGHIIFEQEETACYIALYIPKGGAEK